MLKKYWNDPVWSKVISAVIIAAGTFLFSIVYSLVTQSTIKESLLYIWTSKVDLGPTITCLILLIIFSSVIKKIRQNKPKKIEALENKFHKEFNKLIDSENKITYRFNAYISSRTNFPFISDLRVYCNNHEEALMTESNGCNRIGCKHYGVSYDIREIKQEIETQLLGEWEKMKR